jgi:hypothetical protein
VAIERLHCESWWALACYHYNPAEAATVLQEAYLKILEKKAVFKGSPKRGD